MKSVAIVLAAGSGSRMNNDIPKQYMELRGKPLIYYSLQTFEDSSVDEIILVVGKDEIDYNRKHIVEKYKFSKVKEVVAGGSERYFSVYNGLKTIKEADYILVHDGARPFVSHDLVEAILKDVRQYKACVLGVPSKDTVKIVNDSNLVTNTPDRKYAWIVQTPQAFSYFLIKKAYEAVIMELSSLGENDTKPNITDDAMVVEHYTNHPIKLIEGSYANIKITTPEDIIVGDALIKSH